MRLHSLNTAAQTYTLHNTNHSVPIMKFFAIACLFATAVLQVASAYNVIVPAHERQCFYEMLEKDDRMHVSFQVGEGGHLDIDFWISGPDDNLLEDATKSPSASYNILAENRGKHQFCFSNSFSTITEKDISFNVLVIRAVKEDATHKIDPLENEVRELAASIEEVKNEQEYTVVRERTHRNTAESTNSRVMWWSLIQSGLLFVVCVFQITYLKRFFEVKRVI